LRNLDWLIQIENFVPFSLAMPLDNLFFLLGESGCLDFPVLRFYTWSKPTISIGYHQSFDDFDLNLLKANNIGIVKRITGGRAVAHFNDITYSVILPGFLNIDHKSLYSRTHQIFHYALLNAGIQTDFTQSNFDLTNRKEIPKTCFSSSAKWELRLNDKKCVGSAQKIGRNKTILQHGSIPIGNDYLQLVKYLDDCEAKKEKLAEYLKKKTACIADWNPSCKFDSLVNSFVSSFQQELNIQNFIPFQTKDYI